MIEAKKILITIDYNPTSQRVAEAGYEMAKAMNAQVVLLHVITNPAYYASSVYDPIMGFGGFINLNLMESSLLSDLKKTAQDFLNKAKSHLEDDDIETIIEEGDIATAIIDTAKENKIDIIVMGSHSSKWLEHILIGSTAADVLKQSTIPLYIIPTKKQH